MTCIAFGSAPSASLTQAMGHALENNTLEVLCLPLCKEGRSQKRSDLAWPTLSRPGATREQLINEALSNTSLPGVVLLDAALEVPLDFFQQHAFALSACPRTYSLGPVKGCAVSRNDILARYLAQPGVRFDATLIPDVNDVAGNFFSSHNVAFRRSLLNGKAAYVEQLEGQAADIDWGRRLYLAQIRVRVTPAAAASLALDEPLPEVLRSWEQCGTQIHGLMAQYPDTIHRLAIVRYAQKAHLSVAAYREARDVTNRIIEYFLRSRQEPTPDEVHKAFNLIAILHTATLTKGFLSRLDNELQQRLLELSFESTPDPASETQLFSQKSV